MIRRKNISEKMKKKVMEKTKCSMRGERGAVAKGKTPTTVNVS